MTKLITKQYKLHFTQLFTGSILESAPGSYYVLSGASEYDTYYVFTAKHVDRIGTKTAPLDNIRTILTDTYQNMLFGKKLSTDDSVPAVRNIPYEPNKVYAMYDDTDEELFDKDFYCAVDEESYYHVYKCLDNNLGSVSTITPSFAHIQGSNTTLYQTSDGYRWKYMYSIFRDKWFKFATDQYMPFISNTENMAAAIPGSIEIIKIDVEGKNYNNYTNGIFNSAELRIDGDDNIYAISPDPIANSTVKPGNGYFTGCLMYLSAGPGAGQYRTVTDYYSNGTGNYVVVNSQFTTPPQNGTKYEISPQVQVYGDGGQSINVVARALINSLSTNSVYRIESLNIGRGYKYATANVVANSVVGVSLQAEVRPILVPPGGHGSKPCCELGTGGYIIGITFANSESNTITYTNTYDQIGVLRNPRFANVLINHTGANGRFLEGEEIYRIDPVRIQQGAVISSTASPTISCANGDFANQIANGDILYLKSSNNTSHMLGTVNVVVNSSTFTLTTNALFSCTDVDIYFANVSANAYVTTIANNDHLFINNVSGVIGTGNLLIGKSTGARVEVAFVQRNGVNKNFETFMQMYKYRGTVTTGAFQHDEIVFQGNSLSTSTANGYFHSMEDSNTTFYVSGQLGNVVFSESLKGRTSEATAAINVKYDPELVYGSGDILYLENIDTVTRENNQSESIKLIFEF